VADTVTLAMGPRIGRKAYGGTYRR
jgi:hypothetical protein